MEAKAVKSWSCINFVPRECEKFDVSFCRKLKETCTTYGTVFNAYPIIMELMKYLIHNSDAKKKAITQTVKDSDYTNDKYANQFGIQNSDQMTQIEARVLDAPKIMFNGGIVKSWSCINFAPCECEKFDVSFSHELRETCTTYGTIVKDSDYTNDKYANEFEIQISDQMTKVEVRVLDTPKLTYGDSYVVPIFENWNMKDKIMFNGEIVKSWSCINFAPCECEKSTVSFCGELRGACTTYGTIFNAYTIITELMKYLIQNSDAKKKAITQIVKDSDYTNDKYANQFGIQISDHMTQIEARVLVAPKLTYGDSYVVHLKIGI